MPIDAQLLAELPLFSNLTHEELGEIAEHCHLSRVARGTDVIGEGDAPGHPLYVLLSGRVAIVKHGRDNRRHVISQLSAPNVFGEMEVLATRPALAGVVALQAVSFATLGGKAIAALSKGGRPCILKLITNLAATLSYRVAASDARPPRGDNAPTPRVGELRQVLYGGWDATRVPR